MHRWFTDIYDWSSNSVNKIPQSITLTITLRGYPIAEDFVIFQVMYSYSNTDTGTA